MSLASFALLGWLLFGMLFVLAVIIAFTLRRLGRDVSRDDVLLIFTKSIGATVFGLVCGFVAGIVVDHYFPDLAWFAYLVAIVVGTSSAALTWKYGQARIR